MKHIKYFVSTAVCGAVLAFATLASGQTVQQGVATVVRIQGTARYSTGDNVWHSLTVGQTLGADDTVQTAASSTVDLVLSDKAVRVNQGAGAGSLIGGSVNIAGLPVTPISAGGNAAPQQDIVRLQADTELGIDKFTYSQTGADTVTDTELNLKAGKIFGNVKKISAASEFIVKTPTGVAGIRGTGVFFGADGTATVVSGSAVVSEIINGVTVTVTLTRGQSFDPATYNPNIPAQDQVVTLTGRAFGAAVSAAETIVHIANDASAPPVITAIINTVGDTTTVHISPTAGEHTTTKG